MVEQYEPIAWAEELIEPARAVDHPRLAALYVMASQCYMAGRPETAVRYSDAAQTVLGNGRDEVPYGLEGWVGGAYVYIGQPERVLSGAAPNSHAVATPTHSPRQPWSSR